MFRYITVTVIFAILVVGVFAETKKPTVLVCNFETAGGAKTYLSDSTAKMLMTALTYIGEYKVLSEEKQLKLMESIGNKAGDNVTKTEAVEAANTAGAKYVVTGKITKDDKYYTVTVNFIDVATGDVIETRSSKHIYQRNISKSIDDIVGLTE
jgi:TolB-like protein